METMEMNYDIPSWAKQRVTANSHSFTEVCELYREGKTQIQLPELKKLKNWAKSHRWPKPWFGFKDAFIATLFESNMNFTQALLDSGIEIYVPIKEHILTLESIKELDALYDSRVDTGEFFGQRPNDWGALVRRLREIRRLVEAGVKVSVEESSTVLDTWQSFYSWAHGRYHMLEDGYDSWIGDDN